MLWVAEGLVKVSATNCSCNRSFSSSSSSNNNNNNKSSTRIHASVGTRRPCENSREDTGSCGASREDGS